MSKEIVAGVSFVGNHAQLAVFEQRDFDTKLLYLEEFPKISQHDLWFLENLLEPKIRILKKVSKVSVALDTSSVILHSFPIDTNLNQTQQNEHVHWELSNFVPHYRAKDYVYDMHVLRTRARDHVAEVLVVSVKRLMIYNIQNTLAGNKIELHIADITFLGAQHSLLSTYPEVKQKMAALVFVGIGRTDIGWLSNGRLVDYRYGLDSSSEAIIKMLQEQNSVVSEIYCCGPIVSAELRGIINKSLNVNVTILNPFRQFIKTSSFDKFESFVGLEHRFAACTGLALRKL